MDSIASDVFAKVFEGIAPSGHMKIVRINKGSIDVEDNCFDHARDFRIMIGLIITVGL
jgi:hypothetical protein